MKRGWLTSFWLLKLMAVFALGALTGCLGLESNTEPKTVLPNPAANRPISSLAITEIAGMPEKTASRLRAHLREELASRGITLVNSPQKAAYSLKGFTSTAVGTQGLTLVNIWEVLDKNGRRTHRFIGEENGPASPTGDPWASVNSTMLNAVAVNLARDYKAWTLGRPSPSSVPPATARPVHTAPARKPAPVRMARSVPLVTGSIPASPARSAISIARLTGAPGDGNTALAKALKSALEKNGYKVVNPGQRASYTITGRVHVFSPKEGRQDLTIDWVLKDAAARQIGIIRQRNRVRAFALKRQWGATASGAARAAASHIVKLLR